MAEPILGPLGIDFAAVDATQKHPLGMEVTCVDGYKRKYICAGATITVMDFLKVDTAEGINDFTPITDEKDVVEAVSEVAIADNSFGWVITKGIAVGRIANATVIGDRLGASSIAATLDTLVVTADTGPSAAQAERILSAAQGRRAVCVVAPTSDHVYGTVRIG